MIFKCLHRDNLFYMKHFADIDAQVSTSDILVRWTPFSHVAGVNYHVTLQKRGPESEVNISSVLDLADATRYKFSNLKLENFEVSITRFIKICSYI